MQKPQMKKEYISSMEFWELMINSLSKKKKIISKQLNLSKKQFPELAFAFQMTLRYSGFLERRARTLWRLAFPQPNEDLPSRIQIDCKLTHDTCPEKPIPEEIEAGLVAMETREMEELISPKKPHLVVRQCSDIRRDYQEALECVTRYSQQESLTSAEIMIWQQCIINLNKYFLELIENDCVREDI